MEGTISAVHVAARIDPLVDVPLRERREGRGHGEQACHEKGSVHWRVNRIGD